MQTAKMAKLGSWRRASSVIVPLMKEHKEWQTNISALPYGSGAPIASAEYGPCLVCGKQDTCYTVCSHCTIMYRFCTACGYEHGNVRYYSDITRELQYAIAQVSPAYRAALTEQEANEAAAIKEFNRLRKKGLTEAQPRARNYYGQPVGNVIAKYDKLAEVNADLVGSY